MPTPKEAARAVVDHADKHANQRHAQEDRCQHPVVPQQAGDDARGNPDPLSVWIPGSPAFLVRIAAAAHPRDRLGGSMTRAVGHHVTTKGTPAGRAFPDRPATGGPGDTLLTRRC